MKGRTNISLDAPPKVTLGPLGILPSFAEKGEIQNKLSYLQDFDMSRERDEMLYEPKFKLRHGLIPLVELEFKRFLSLRLLFPNPDFAFSPTLPVDLMWHCLIIDTMRYFEICNNLYGEYLHHRPLDPLYVAASAGLSLGYTKQCLAAAYGGPAPSVWGLAPERCDYSNCEDHPLPR